MSTLTGKLAFYFLPNPPQNGSRAPKGWTSDPSGYELFKRRFSRNSNPKMQKRAPASHTIIGRQGVFTLTTTDPGGWTSLGLFQWSRQYKLPNGRIVKTEIPYYVIYTLSAELRLNLMKERFVDSESGGMTGTARVTLWRLPLTIWKSGSFAFLNR